MFVVVVAIPLSQRANLDSKKGRKKSLFPNILYTEKRRLFTCSSFYIFRTIIDIAKILYYKLLIYSHSVIIAKPSSTLISDTTASDGLPIYFLHVVVFITQYTSFRWMYKLLFMKTRIY